MAEPAITVTIVNHVAMDIAVDPAVVWDAIQDEYVQATKFREFGYAIEPLSDPASFRGGYLMRLEKDGNVVDERVCRITELDAAALRLSLHADYAPATSDGVMVYATYHAQPSAGGARYTIDCHSRMGIEAPPDGDLTRAVTELTSQFEEALSSYLAGVKAKLENKH